MPRRAADDDDGVLCLLVSRVMMSECVSALMSFFLDDR
jgi:hypothetical protein